jgi:hypothetical protein
MKNMKKVLGLVLVGAMVVPMAACGNKASTSTGGSGSKSGKKEAEGKVLNIQCWNDEFANRLADHYPGYKKNDEKDATKGGKIGDVEVKFTVTPSKDNAYQNNLDKVLPGNASAKADNKVDIFLVEADYAKKYTNSSTEVTEKIKDLGITDDDIKDQYKYTKDMVTDSKGDLRGLSWQGCPGVLIYNAAIAKQVLGSDDPDTVQKSVADWDTFYKTAETMKASGFKMTATANDTYRVYDDNKKSAWVDNGKIDIPKSDLEWADKAKEMFDKGECTTDDLWSDGWSAGFKAPGDTFCYFGPAWLINFSMGNAPDSDKGDDGSIAFQGGWRATAGPQAFNWGGTWICAAKGTDNKTLVADIMKKLTCDKDIMLDITKKDSDFVNNKPAMEEAAKNGEGFKVLGGQNPLPLFTKNAEKVDFKYADGIYTQGITEEFQSAMKDYFTGKVDKDAAIDTFYKNVVTKYPELSKK